MTNADVTLFSQFFVDSVKLPGRKLYHVAGKGNLGFRADTGELFYSADDGPSQAFFWNGGDSASLYYGQDWPGRSVFVYLERVA